MYGVSATVYNPYNLEKFQRHIPLLDSGFDYHDDMRTFPAREGSSQKFSVNDERSFDLY